MAAARLITRPIAQPPARPHREVRRFSRSQRHVDGRIMSGQSRWWGIPGALLVLTGVLALGNKERAESETANPDPAQSRRSEPSDLPELVLARDASGRRHFVPTAATLQSQVLRLILPERFAGKHLEVTLWRRIHGQREQQPWIQMRPLLRADATLPMAGIVPGSYDMEVGLIDEPHFLVENVRAPGDVSFATASPVR